MSFNFAQYKKQARQTLHSVMAVPAFYQDGQTSSTAIPVRWHNKLVNNGASPDGYDATIIEGINRLVFQEPDLTLAGITLRRGGLVMIPDYDDAIFKLDTEAPQDGPLNVYWNVSYEKPTQ